MPPQKPPGGGTAPGGRTGGVSVAQTDASALGPSDLGSLASALAQGSRKPDPYGFGADWLDAQVTYGPFGGHKFTGTANGFMAWFYKANPAIQAQIQTWLYQAGYYGGKYTPDFGVVGPKDEKALRSAVRLAAQTGRPIDQVLAEAADYGTLLGVGQDKALNYETTVHTLRLSNPADIRSAMEQGFTDALGRAPTEEEKARFVAAFHGSEAAAQQAVFGSEDVQRQAYIDRQRAEQEGGGAGSVVPPRPDVATPRSAIEEDIPGIGTSGGAPGVEDFLRGLRTVESGGNYAWKANPWGATGAYQILGSNWPVWAREAGVNPNDHSSAAQDSVARFKVSQYFYAYGQDWRKVAAAWYTGTPNPSLDRNPGNGPTPRRYIEMVLGAAGDPNAGGAANALGGGNIPVSTTVSVTDPGNPAIVAEEQARKEHPVESVSYDLVKQFENLTDLLGPATRIGSNG